MRDIFLTDYISLININPTIVTREQSFLGPTSNFKQSDAIDIS
jgi:hypothetical protein